ncbi:MAG: hypothetical protein R2831_01225 [Chitinophagaceae bacterium]
MKTSKHLKNIRFLFFLCLMLSSFATWAQWTALNNLAPNDNQGVMVLLSDGRVMCKSGGGGGSGRIWNILTPSSTGSYVAGTWTSTTMVNDRRFFATQVLKDGRLYVCGGEYGAGGNDGELYNPVTNTWTNIPAPGGFISDACSEILEDGRVLQAIVGGTQRTCKLWDPATNTFSAAGNTIGSHNEATWTKLADGSILMVPKNSFNSERYIPATNTWIADGVVPVNLYSAFGSETGGAAMLPNGQLWWVGGSGNTAYYTPSGNTSPGTWTAGPSVPSGYGQPDAPVSMMPDGKVLLTVSPAPISGNVFQSPTRFYEFNYLTNTYTLLNAPGGGTSLPITCYTTNFLNLPNGQILYGQMSSTQYYVYTPSGTPSASWKPTITGSITSDCNSYKIYGTQFNGRSEGTVYGDDWQMNTNYPIVRLNGGLFNLFNYYARTYNWNSTGVRRGSNPDTTEFDLPAGLANGTYNLSVTANGISSNTISFNTYPSLTSSLSESTCSGAIFTYTPTYDRSCVSSPWSRAAVSGISNAAASGAGSINETLINTTTTPKTVVYEYTLSHNGYTNTESVSVIVNPRPNLTLSTTSICADVTTAVTASGATSYNWLSPVFSSASTVNLTPTGTRTYTVVGSNTYGCNDTAYLYANASPVVAAFASPSTICQGDTSNLSRIASSLELDSLFTTLDAGNGVSGNVFNVHANKTITINKVKMHISSGSNAEVWYKTSSYGNANLTSSTGWTKLGATVPITAAGLNALTEIPITTTLTIPAGATYGFVVVCDGSNRYSNGTLVGAVYKSNQDLYITQGHGGTGMGGIFNFTNSPRLFNGEIVYQVNNVVTSTAWSPSTGLSDPAISNPKAGPISPIVYTATVTDANGCTGTGTRFLNVNPAPIVGATNTTPSEICLGNSTSVNYISPNVPSCNGEMQTGFANTYAPSNWALLNSNSNGTVNTATSPDSISLVSSDGLSGSGTTDFSITVPCTGQVTFDWRYTTVDGSFYDRPRYAVNGNTPVEFDTYVISGGSSLQTGTQSIFVNAGDILHLQAYSTDNVAGSCTIFIKNFVAPTQSTPSQTVYWYTAPTGGTYVGFDSFIYTPKTSGTIKFYGDLVNNATGCLSLSKIVSNPVHVNALPEVSTSATPSTICAGQTSQLLATSTSIEQDSLQTPYNSNNGLSGNAFDITASKTITITDFKMNIGSGTQAEVWYKAGGYGNANVTSNTGWTKLGATVAITAAGNDLPTLIPTTANLTIPAGQTYGIIIVCNGNNRYTNGTAVGNVVVSNPDLSIYEGHGGSGMAGAFSFNLSPRIWNGEVIYTVNNGISGIAWAPSTSLSNASISNPVASPTNSTIYNATVTDGNGCTTTKPINVYVNTVPLGTASASPTPICLGAPISLNYVAPAGLQCTGAIQSGFAGTYAPANWTTLNSNSNATINVGSAPASISMVSSNGLSGSGFTNYTITTPCSGILSFDWSYTTVDGATYDYPRYAINGGSYNLFPGYSTGLGTTPQNGTVNIPVVAGQSFSLQIYSTDNVAGSCTVNITNFKAPIQSTATETVAWYSASTGGTLYGSSNPQTHTPTVSGGKVYYAQVSNTSNGCVSASRVASNVVTINPLPNVVASASPSTICNGSSTTLTGTGASSYVWNPGAIGGNNVVVAPSSATTYTVIGLDGNGCTKTNTVAIAVNPKPTVSITSSANSVCNGSSVSLTGNGASTYVWNPGGLTGTTVSPTVNGNTTYTVTGTSALGCTNTATKTITVTTCSNAITLKFYIQGYYAGGGTMSTVLLNQGIGSSATNVDDVTVELHNATFPYALAHTTSAMLQSNGQAVANFPGTVSGSYYIVIKHRNSIETWSANPYTFTGTNNYDFSNAISKAYGSNQVEVETNVWSLYNGDVNQDGFIDIFDFLDWDVDNQNFASGYFVTDLNGDGFVDIFDFLIWDPNNQNFIGLLTP